MVSRRSGGDYGADGDADSIVVRRRWGWRRIASYVALAVLVLLLVAVAVLWIARRPIASNVLERELEKRGVEATYELERVGLRTQIIRNVVIGDPDDPDLVARYAQVQVRVQWDGSIEIFRVVARGVRLKGELEDGRVSWGELDKLLPPPSDQPFRFPDITLDIADSSISLATPAGPLGFAVRGSGNLTGGFKGRMAAASPGLDLGRCRLEDMKAVVAMEITARRPRLEGPVTAQRFGCPESRFVIDAPRFEIDSRFSEGFDTFEGVGRMAAERIVAGENGLANLTGNVTFDGSPSEARGQLELAGRQSRLGPIFAERTRINGRYRLGAASGTMALVGQYAAEDAELAPAMLGGIADGLAAVADTPAGPVATAIANAIRANTRSFDANGEIRVVNGPRGGAARIESANVRTDRGARVRVSGGDGVTYYWPSAGVRIDGRIQMAGGGLPTGNLQLSQPRRSGGISGIARFRPYSAGGSTLSLEPIRFAATPGGATNFGTVASLSGPFPEGRVRGLRMPVTGTIGTDGSLLVGRRCITATVDYFEMRGLRLGPTRLPICPTGEAILVQRPGGSMRINARIAEPRLAGTLGETPLLVTAGSARIIEGRDFELTDASMRLGQADSPILFEPDVLRGTFRGSGVSGTFSGADAVIRNVPLLISEGEGDWGFYHGDLTVEAQLMLSDRAEEARFYSLRSDDFRFTLAGDDIRAGGTLRHPDSGTLVTDVAIAHRLSTGEGQALLDVPGIRFGESIQPEEITPLTEGVVALVQGPFQGQGQISWSGGGEVSSTGEFSTADMDLAAPFGPVAGLTTTVRFSDLLALETEPGQTATVEMINPGILVENGVITYQLLTDQLVRVQRGQWPFMGGTLILQETILNFGRPSAKRLTFQVVGFDAKTFIDSLGFAGIEITGTFDGVLPMIFDDEGGRLVGGRLESRPPGGVFRYIGTKPDVGLVGGVAFDLLSNMRYESMVVRLDGDLAGEFATRFTISEVSLGSKGGFLAGLVRGAFSDVPLIVNLNVTGPFRALIQTAKGFRDPTPVIAPVMPFPLDAPGIVTETRTLSKEEEQERTTPATVETPTESER